MASLRGTTARLRRTFQYPTDDSSNDSPDVMDEEEQENLIASLAEQNEQRNAQFRQILLFLPALSAVPFLLVLFRPPTFLLSFFSLSSLAATAYLLYRLPPTETGISLLDAWAAGQPMGMASSASGGSGEERDSWRAESSSAAVRVGSGLGLGLGVGSGSGSRRRRSSSFNLGQSHQQHQHRTPLEAWLPYLNLGLAAVVLLMGILGGRAQEEIDGWLGRVGLGNLPLVVYIVILVAKVVMGSVDPEKELGGLRYEFKGA